MILSFRGGVCDPGVRCATKLTHSDNSIETTTDQSQADNAPLVSPLEKAYDGGPDLLSAPLRLMTLHSEEGEEGQV